MYKHLPSGGRLIHTFVWKKGTRRSEGLDCKAFKYLLMSCWSQGDTVSTDGASFPYQLLLRCDLQMKYFGWGGRVSLEKQSSDTWRNHSRLPGAAWERAPSQQQGIQRCWQFSDGAGTAQRGESWCCLLALCALCLEIKKQMAGWSDFASPSLLRCSFYANGSHLLRTVDLNLWKINTEWVSVYCKWLLSLEHPAEVLPRSCLCLFLLWHGDVYLIP